MAVITTSKYSMQNTKILKRKNTFSPYEKKVAKKKEKKKESPMKTDPDEIYDLLCVCVRASVLERGGYRENRKEETEKAAPG